MNYYPVTDRQTDRKRCIWAHRAICTGGLKNPYILHLPPTATHYWHKLCSNLVLCCDPCQLIHNMAHILHVTRGSSNTSDRFSILILLEFWYTAFSPIEPTRVWGGYNRNNAKNGRIPTKMVWSSPCKRGSEGKIALYHLRIYSFKICHVGWPLKNLDRQKQYD